MSAGGFIKKPYQGCRENVHTSAGERTVNLAHFENFLGVLLLLRIRVVCVTEGCFGDCV